MHMKTFFRYFSAVAICVLFTFETKAQVSVQSHNNQTAQSLVESSFLGGGVSVSNVRFNGNLSLGTSNQVGSFTNPDTTGNNIKLNSGIVLTTGNISDATSGQAEIHNGTGCSNCYNSVNALPLHYMMLNINPNYADNLNDISCLSFDFVTTGDKVSFKYVFASDEYQNYVCSQFNDAFGFFISGPFEDDGVTPINAPGITHYLNHNIAIVPGTTDEIVSINTVNGNPDNLTSSTPTCDISHTNLFINNFTGSINKFLGYTKAFETEKLVVLPCYKYNIIMAVCDVSDQNLMSGVYLGANSFRTDNYKFSGYHNGDTISIDTINKAPCDSITIKVKLNRPAEANESYTIRVKGDMIAGVDYVDFGNQLNFPQGDSVVSVTIHFIANPNDVPGTVQHLQILGEYFSDCVPVDTINLYARIPYPLTIDSISPHRIYCSDVLPQRERVVARAINGIGAVSYHWVDAAGNSVGEYPNSDTNAIVVNEPMTVTVTASDGCSRSVSANVNFSIHSATTDATVDKDKICSGDSVTLSCTSAVSYQWSAKPLDPRLSLNSTVHNPIAAPLLQTMYYITTVDSNGCIASDSVSVLALPKITAKIYVSPEKLYYSQTEMKYIDNTTSCFKREWDFGDGTTSTLQSGLHSYPNTEAKDYNIMLVVYNEALCTDTAYAKVSVQPDFTIWIPNAFTPGNTKGNNIFKPYSSINLKYSMKIFNRWGKQIFFTEKSGVWDGKLDNGKYAPNGSYSYVIDYLDGAGLKQQKSGTLNLINAGN